MTNFKLALNIELIADSKVARIEETESVGKTNSREKPPPEKSTNFYEIQRKFHDRENDYNEENQVTAKDIENNNENNRLRINGSNIQNSNNEGTVKPNQSKLAFILGDSMVEDIDGYLLTGSINRKFIVKVRPFLSAKNYRYGDYIKPTKRHFNSDLYILHVGTNDLSLDDTAEVTSSRIKDTA